MWAGIPVCCGGVWWWPSLAMPASAPASAAEQTSGSTAHRPSGMQGFAVCSGLHAPVWDVVCSCQGEWRLSMPCNRGTEGTEGAMVGTGGRAGDIGGAPIPPACLLPCTGAWLAKLACRVRLTAAAADAQSWLGQAACLSPARLLSRSPRPAVLDVAGEEIHHQAVPPADGAPAGCVPVHCRLHGNACCSCLELLLGLHPPS